MPYSPELEVNITKGFNSLMGIAASIGALIMTGLDAGDSQAKEDLLWGVATCWIVTQSIYFVFFLGIVVRSIMMGGDESCSKQCVQACRGRMQTKVEKQVE